MALAAAMPSNNHHVIPEPRVFTSSAEINDSLFADAIVQKDCSVHVRGSVTGSLTIEPGADVLVDGSVYGKIVNRGGRLKPDTRFAESYASCRRAARPHRACPRHDTRAKLHRRRAKAASHRIGFNRAYRRLS